MKRVIGEARPRPVPRFALLVPVALLLVAMASMQLGAAFAKGLFPKVGPQGATALRLTFSALILAAVRRPWRELRLGRSALPLVAYGVSLGAMNTLFYMALRTVPLGVAIALEFIGPLTLAASRSRRWLDAAWIALAAAGLLLLLPLGHTARAVDPAGAALALASGACWALYIVFGRRVGQAFGPRGTALGMLIAAAVFAPIGAIRAGPALFALDILPAGLLLALLSSAVPYSLEMIALTRLPVRAFGTLMSLEPAVGALAGLAILGEDPTPAQWAGIAAVILASLGTTLAGAGA
jgi:inner membrane transporter RhtA